MHELEPGTRPEHRLTGQVARAIHSNVNANDTIEAAPAGTDVCQISQFNAEVVARVRAAAPSDDDLSEAQLLFGALSDRQRLRIVHALLQAKELCVCDVAQVLGSSVSAASHHLRKMRDLRILGHRTDGKMVFYSLRDARVAELVAAVLGREAPAKGRKR